MTTQSRRNFLKATSVGGTALGTAILWPRLFDQPASAHAVAEQGVPGSADAIAHGGPFVAYVKNAKTGEIAVLAGEHEIVHRDPQLAARLAQVAALAPQA